MVVATISRMLGALFRALDGSGNVRFDLFRLLCPASLVRSIRLRTSLPLRAMMPVLYPGCKLMVAFSLGSIIRA